LTESENPLPLFRETLDRGTRRLEESFRKNAPIRELVGARAYLMDELLRHAWRLHIPTDPVAALIAVGGYGRGELHPASDIDLMILLGDGNREDLHDPIERFLMFLWDIGLEVGHSVRTLEDCVREAKQDITVATNLMEARSLAGPLSLYDRMCEATGPKNLWPSRAFFMAKSKEQEARYHKYDDTGYNLEPNIKESPGGLRDIHMVGWVAKRHFGAKTLHDLVSHGFLSEQEYQQLLEGETFLWKIRFGLHSLSERREDRLRFDFQPQLAEMFGFTDQDHSLAVEQFMQQYYRTVMELSRLNEMLMQLFQEAILFRENLGEPVPINSRFQSRNGFIEVTHDRVFQRTPSALLEVFFLLQTHRELTGVRASTIRLIRANRHLIDAHFRDSLTARSLFMEIMRHPRYIYHELRRMNLYGILAAYIPAFANIVGRMQYDLFHVYTVDEHTLFVIRNLRRFALPEYHHEFPLCSWVIQTLPKLELLYIAALFHDIAKGRGGDHSKLGAKDTLAFCQKHHLSNMDSHLVAWLVEKHLILSMTAQRKDIGDPEVIQAFAEEVADPVRLDYLYLLTVADSRATNPQRWNAWRDALLKDLYGATHLALARGLDNPQAQEELIQEKQTETQRLLGAGGTDTNRIVEFWRSVNPEYFLQNSPDEIAWHTAEILASDPDELPLVRIRNKTRQGGTEVFTYGRDQDNLFACSTMLLDQLGLNVQDARIITTDDGYTLNSYLVLEEDGNPVLDVSRTEEIFLTLNAGLMAIHDLDLNVSRRIPRQHKHFDTRPRVTFSQDRRRRHTIMRLVASDRPGLLSKVGQAFTECSVRLQSAKIATVGAEADDIFFVTTLDHRPLHDQRQLDCLAKAVTSRLDSGLASK
jgi:[protein-PII] uridylyltransferase